MNQTPSVGQLWHYVSLEGSEALIVVLGVSWSDRTVMAHNVWNDRTCHGDPIPLSIFNLPSMTLLEDTP